MGNFIKHFWFDFVWAVIALTFVYYMMGSAATVTAFCLAVLELSVSFDNAVVNAKKLEVMSRFWRTMFLTLGMLIAVGVVRFYLPLQIVSSLGEVSLSEAFNMAVKDPAQFAQIISHSHDMIAGFGGGFLGMLALTFFIDEDKEALWLKPIEKPLKRLGSKLPFMGNAVMSFIILIVVACVFSALAGIHSSVIILSTVAGCIIYEVVDLIKMGLEKSDEALAASKFKFLSGGFGAFIFCEVLDASMSMDGVVAAVSISGEVLVVAAGLSIGALVVRSLTIKLVEDGTLSELGYLETAAFYSIFLVAASMYVGLLIEIPEWFMGAVSAVVIAAGAVHSMIENKASSQLAAA